MRTKSVSPRVYAAGFGKPASTTHCDARSTFSGTMSQSARISQPSIFSRFCTCALPMPPMPTKPMRTVSIGGAAKGRLGDPDSATTGALSTTPASPSPRPAAAPRRMASRRSIERPPEDGSVGFFMADLVRAVEATGPAQHRGSRPRTSNGGMRQWMTNVVFFLSWIVCAPRKPCWMAAISFSSSLWTSRPATIACSTLLIVPSELPQRRQR